MLSADRKLDHRQSLPVEYGYYVQGGAHVFRGSIVALCSDFTLIPNGAAQPAGSAPPVVIVGISERQMVGGNPSTGAPVSSLNAPVAIRCRRGSYQVPFDAPPPAAAINTPVFAIDDQTVSLSNGAVAGGPPAHLQCGVLEGFDELGNPWVKF